MTDSDFPGMRGLQAWVEEEVGEDGKGTAPSEPVAPSWITHIISGEKWRWCYMEGKRRSPLAFYSPKTRDWEVWPEEKGVTVKRSDGERKGTEKNRKWPWEGYKRSREVAEEIKSKNERRSVTVWADIRQSRQLYRAKDMKGCFTLPFPSLF